jgi:hypothetical protein
VPFSCGTGKANQCGCVPLTCASMGATCGTMLDGCGGQLSCGACGNGGRGRGGNRVEVCVGVGPSTCSEEGLTCTPANCARFNAHCGEVSDGCGGVLNCGTCTYPDVCGGAGAPNQCGCLSTTCDKVGANCGTINDGCGKQLACGTCAAGLSCDPLTNRCTSVQ